MTDGLAELARAVRARAHCPYSRFAVGAALEAEDGRIFTGCNVENASYGLALCAERTALAAAVAAGARRFRRLVVVTDADPPAAPCGACRQMLAEFGLELVIDAVGSSTERRWTLGALLPDPFAARSLPPQGE
jgi:cytidine deaminase